jgi:hypothetical protein
LAAAALVESIVAGIDPEGGRIVEREPFAYSTSFPIEALSIEWADGRCEALVLKRLARAALTDAARLAKPEHVAAHEREPHVYERLLAPCGLDRGIYRGSFSPPAAEESWLLLARVRGPVLFESGELADWEEAARLAAEVHAAGPPAAVPPLLGIGSASLASWLERASGFLGQGESRARQALARIAAAAKWVGGELEAIPPTVVHGELFPSNVLIDERADRRAVAIDWEMAAVGPGLVDLAALTAGELPEGWAEAIEDAYRSRLTELAPELVPASFDRALACCRLYLAVERLGWAPRSWEPPAAHRQDWLQVASDLVEGLS